MADFFNVDDDDFVEEDTPAFETPGQAEPDFDDTLDQLRDKSARTSASHDAMDMSVDDEFSGGGSGFALSNFTTAQKLILLALLLLDIVAIGFGILVATGRI